MSPEQAVFFMPTTQEQEQALWHARLTLTQLLDGDFGFPIANSEEDEAKG